MRSLGESPSEDELLEYLDDIESFGKRSMDLKEFISIMTKHQVKVKDLEEEIIGAFKAYSSDSSGFIDGDELINILMNFGERLPETDIEKIARDVCFYFLMINTL